MTVAIAAIFQYVYDASDPKKVDFGPAVITASDRMLTVDTLGIEYEPMQQKWARVLPTVEILVADSITIHSELLLRLKPFLEANPGATVHNVAEEYASLLREHRRAHAERVVLSVYGLTTEAYISRQRVMDPNIVVELGNQMRQEEAKITAQALVVGVDKDRTAHLFYIDSAGTVSCFDDIGFASIGIGNSHSNLQFMQNGYTNKWWYYEAITLAYSAKKTAEVAPGVGTATDITLITRDNAYFLTSETIALLQKGWTLYQRRLTKLKQQNVEEFKKADIAAAARNASDASAGGAKPSPAAILPKAASGESVS